MKSPDEWQREIGTRRSVFAAATVIYRWAHHEHHYGPIQLSEADYRAAVETLTQPYYKPAMGKG